VCYNFPIGIFVFVVLWVAIFIAKASKCLHQVSYTKKQYNIPTLQRNKKYVFDLLHYSMYDFYDNHYFFCLPFYEYILGIWTEKKQFTLLFYKILNLFERKLYIIKFSCKLLSYAGLLLFFCCFVLLLQVVWSILKCDIFLFLIWFLEFFLFFFLLSVKTMWKQKEPGWMDTSLVLVAAVIWKLCRSFVDLYRLGFYDFSPTFPQKVRCWYLIYSPW
jgi:hypothetical protein